MLYFKLDFKFEFKLEMIKKGGSTRVQLKYKDEGLVEEILLGEI